MTRPSAIESIVLPRLTAAGALALGKQIIAAAEPYKKAKTLPKAVVNGLKGVHQQWDELSIVLRDLLKPSLETAQKPDAPKADRILDACYSALNDFFESRRKLFWRHDAAEAAELQRLVFPDGLKFIQLPYPLEWAESETRLQSMKENKLDTRIEALGGQVFLVEIHKAHEAYGAALGMTKPLATNSEESPRVRKARDAFADKLKRYWINVEGSVDDSESDTRELADVLLAPLMNWDVTTNKGAEESEPDANAGATQDTAGQTAKT